jgi:hypothetical protein
MIATERSERQAHLDQIHGTIAALKDARETPLHSSVNGHAALDLRLNLVEEALQDSVEKHSQAGTMHAKLTSDLEALRNQSLNDSSLHAAHHGTALQRLGALEGKLVGDLTNEASSRDADVLGLQELLSSETIARETDLGTVLALIASEKDERLSHDNRLDHALTAHSLKLDSHRVELLDLRADQDALPGRLRDLTDVRDAEHASLSRLLSELHASLDNRFVEHDSRIEGLLSLHRSELDARLQGLTDKHDDDLPAVYRMFSQLTSDFRELLDDRLTEHDSRVRHDQQRECEERVRTDQDVSGQLSRLQTLVGQEADSRVAALDALEECVRDECAKLADVSLDRHAEVKDACDELGSNLRAEIATLRNECALLEASTANLREAQAPPPPRAAGANSRCATRPEASPPDSRHLVAVLQIKTLQRDGRRVAWHAYCQDSGKASFDPSRHTLPFLQGFIDQQGSLGPQGSRGSFQPSEPRRADTPHGGSAP